MPRVAFLLAAGALVAAVTRAPGLYLAIGLGVAAIGVGWAGYRRRDLRGSARLACAAAAGLGGVGFVLGALRVVLVMSAIAHLDKLLG